MQVSPSAVKHYLPLKLTFLFSKSRILKKLLIKSNGFEEKKQSRHVLVWKSWRPLCSFGNETRTVTHSKDWPTKMSPRTPAGLLQEVLKRSRKRRMEVWASLYDPAQQKHSKTRPTKTSGFLLKLLEKIYFGWWDRSKTPVFQSKSW